MNEKFFSLPQEKQQSIINAGYRVFSQNSYKKSPMNEIAQACGISKSLLFHYFHNKLEFYMFLWDKCAEITMEYLNKYKCYEQKDLFESMKRGMQAKINLMKEYPHMGNFVIKAFYEREPEVHSEIHKSYHKYFDIKTNKTLINLDTNQFIDGIDIQMMYKNMYLASEGYLWEMAQRGDINVKQMENDFIEMIEFWKSIYLRKE